MPYDPKDRAIAVAEQLREQAAAKPLTDAQRKLLDFSAQIFDEPGMNKHAAYMPRELVQLTLPHKNPGNVTEWYRTNGNTTLAIQPGYSTDEATGRRVCIGYPYGIIPRLILFWITTEATLRKSRHLELGNSLASFMAALGLDPNRGGKRSDARRLRDQTNRLINASISFQSTVNHGNRLEANRLNMHVASKSSFWWSLKDPDQPTLWGSWIELSQDFFDAITAFPVPVDIRALRGLKRSPLALDLYAWLSYEAFRAHRIGKSRFENWEQLHTHLGADYKHQQHFRSAVKAAIRKIKVVYPGLKLGERQGGIEVLPESWPSIRPRDLTIDGKWKTL